LFEFNRADIQASDTSKVSEIADYMYQNPSLQLGLDGSNNGRVDTVRRALIQAGVPSSKIQAGAFGDQRLARDQRVEVLVRTGN
jgi:outer membrane protein OmpA-like peptidoglycan-associated protein